MQIKAQLSHAIEAAFSTLGLDGAALVQTSSRPEHGDYQANGVMAAAKRAKRNPREVAAEVIEVLDLTGIASKVDIAGPGFLNITLAADFLAGVDAGHVTASPTPQRVVVDYSAPNLAKEMHVGHLRSTIIGDCIVRVLEAQGHTVLRQNHVGDWGTQFGMLLTYLSDNAANSDSLAYLEDFYRAAKKRFDEDEDFQQRARRAVVELQAGDDHALDMWQHFITVSMSHCQDIYNRLDVTLDESHIQGESAYNDALPGVVEQLQDKGLLTESEGAQCVFLDEFKTKKGEILPVIVQKSDGGYLYATTDLAAVAYRSNELNADRVLYFTDARQALHFKQIFAVARAAGFTDSATSLEHMPFGAMLGDDGKPFKTRAGTVVKLADLLDEAELRATRLVRSKNPDLDEDIATELGHVIGIGAVKYADLSKNRTSDYVFNWEQMISFDGNTSPYLQYAYTRIASIFARGQIDPQTLPAHASAVEEPERRLAVMIAGFNDTLEAVASEGMPHLLCGYLYELATRFTSFYEACPILSSSADVRERRLVLARQTADTLRRGLDLLGIGVVEQM
ncbi:MAG: arginine--tRNA ligase [Pseudomonadaceae bacterium]|nr:arginine--tRNA ligase [Pseudomonadaceae bacterium]